MTILTNRLFGYSLCLSVLLVLPAVAAAQQELVHNCGIGKLGQTIDSFTDKTKVNTLTINGTCDTSENPFGTGSTVRNPFFVAGFTNLTIKAGAGGATISAASETCTPGAILRPAASLCRSSTRAASSSRISRSRAAGASR